MAGARLAGGGRGEGRPEPAAVSRRPVWAIGLLLMVEVAGIAALGAYEFLRIDWRRIVASQTMPSSQEVTEALLVLAFFGPAVLLTLLSALSLLLIRRRGWLLAAISQGLVVAACLWLYAEYDGPPYVYPIMAYAVLMILYLNVHDVRAVFYPGDRKRGPRRLT